MEGHARTREGAVAVLVTSRPGRRRARLLWDGCGESMNLWDWLLFPVKQETRTQFDFKAVDKLSPPYHGRKTPTSLALVENPLKREK